jgi:hypothetical protein
MSCLPPQWLAEPKPNERTEAKAAPSPIVPATTVTGWDHADKSEQRPDHHPQLSCSPPILAG